jgi:hypothetical protein
MDRSRRNNHDRSTEFERMLQTTYDNRAVAPAAKTPPPTGLQHVVASPWRSRPPGCRLRPKWGSQTPRHSENTVDCWPDS